MITEPKLERRKKQHYYHHARDASPQSTSA